MSNADNICWSSLQKPITPGQYFTPFGRDVCEQCKCLGGKAVGCIFEKCSQLPNCKGYKRIQGTCCEYECFENDVLSDKTELAVLFSLGTGLLLLLIILMLVLYCRHQGVKKSQEVKNKKHEVKKTQSITEQSQTTSNPSEIASNTPESSSSDGCVELPPPYTIKPRTATKTQTKAPPNEPPPPYVDKVESTV